MFLSDAPTCGCRGADPLATFEREAPCLVATADRPRDVGHLAVDRAGLRAALGGRAEVVEAMGAKASGRPGVNVARIGSFMTTSVDQSGDLPVLATREAIQNGIDAIKAAIRARKTRAGEGRFAVTWDGDRRALTWEDNGIGMDADTILTKFLSLGDSGKRDAGDSEEAAGGFGVAKAVILGTSKDNHIVAAGSVTEAVRRARAHAHALLRVEVEVESLEELREALAAGADVVLLDNMDDATLREAVAINAGRARLEASGNMTAERIRRLVGIGVHQVSMGGLIHQARWADLSMRVVG
jgi:hypothetical protein